MRLEAILHKTQEKSEKETVKRKTPFIAEEERPYDTFLSLNIDKTISKEAEINRTQTGNKPDTKWTQTGHKKNKPDTKWTQSGHKTGNKVDTNRTQSGHKLVTKWTQKITIKIPISEVVGLQRAILFLIYYECKKSRSRITQPTTLEHFSSQLEVPLGSIKTTLRRLEEKNFISRVSYKNGRSGWTQYELLEQTYQELLLLENENELFINLARKKHETGNKVDTNRTQTGNKVDTQPDTNALSSSSYINTTTIDGSFNFFENENNGNIENIDITPLQSIGFEKSHLQQLLKLSSLSSEIIEDSIKTFSFDLEVNRKAEKIKGSPLNYFMGILRKGLPYLPPDNYESPEARVMRVYIEQKERQKAVKEDLERKKFDLDLEEWIETLTDEEINKLIPEPSYRKKESPFRRGALSVYFRENIWSKERNLVDLKKVKVEK